MYYRRNNLVIEFCFQMIENSTCDSFNLLTVTYCFNNYVEAHRFTQLSLNQTFLSISLTKI